MNIGKTNFSIIFFIGCILIFVGAIGTLVAFSSPYWSQSFSQNVEFNNIGLWQVYK